MRCVTTKAIEKLETRINILDEGLQDARRKLSGYYEVIADSIPVLRTLQERLTLIEQRIATLEHAQKAATTAGTNTWAGTDAAGTDAENKIPWGASLAASIPSADAIVRTPESRLQSLAHDVAILGGRVREWEHKLDLAVNSRANRCDALEKRICVLEDWRDDLTSPYSIETILERLLDIVRNRWEDE